jgi:phage baseplate assembly protein W
MTAIHRSTGDIIQEDGAISAELVTGLQNIYTLLSTPLGSRVYNRAWGSNLPNLLDLPINDTTQLLVSSQIAIDIEKNLYDFLVESVSVDLSEAVSGTMNITINLFFVPENRFVTLAGVKLRNG